MQIPSVTIDQFDQALAECTRNPNNPKSEKRGWNYSYSESFQKELGDLYSLLAGAVSQDPDVQVAASFALNLATVLHHSYKLAGAKFTPLERKELIGLRFAEDDWVLQLRRLPLPIAQEAEEDYFRRRTNGEILKTSIDMLRDFAGMHKPHNPQTWARSLEVARLNLAAAQAAINLSVERAQA